jgi:hypothetical protein
VDVYVKAGVANHQTIGGTQAEHWKCMRALLPPPISSPSGSPGIETEREVLPASFRHERHPRRVHGNENQCPFPDDDFPWPGDTEMDMDEVWP